jgi:Flp pilus assembly protein TadD
MLNGETPQAFSYFRQSLEEDDSFEPAWINLGILYRREAHPDYAEAAYFRALDEDKRNLVAMSNLANLYESQGQLEVAESYREQVSRHRMENPYYRYLLANDAFLSGDYNSAIQNIDYAIRKRPDEDAFLYLKSMTYMMLGNREEARKWMKQAEKVALEAADKRRYSRKLELLKAQGGEGKPD